MISTHGNLENTILNGVWDIEEDEQNTELIDVGVIQRSINSDSQKWAYTTIKTVLDRLVEKKLLSKVKYGRKFFYNSLCSRAMLGEQAIQKLSQQYFKGDLVSLLKAVEALSERELALV